MNFTVIPASWAPLLLSVLRIATGLLFLEHGTGKFFGFPALPGLDQMPSGLLYASGALELVGGALLVIGFLTRPVAFVLSGFMAVAYFMAHVPGGFFPVLNHGELAILFSFACLYVAGGRAGTLVGR
jgi:putative oxidoreductase